MDQGSLQITADVVQVFSYAYCLARKGGSWLVENYKWILWRKIWWLDDAS